MVVIRLSRVGKKNSPAFRVVVADKQRSAKRKYIEVIGHYIPTRQPKVIEIDKERAIFWMDKGAKPSDTVNNLMADLGIIKKSEKVNKKYAKAKKKKDESEKAEEPKAEDAKVKVEEKSVETSDNTKSEADAALETDTNADDNQTEEAKATEKTDDDSKEPEKSEDNPEEAKK